MKIGLDRGFYANDWHGVAQGFERLSKRAVYATYFHVEPAFFSSVMRVIHKPDKTIYNVQVFFIRCI